MSKKIVVVFPGSTGCEIPLLYFGAKHFENKGYEKLFVNHPASPDVRFEEVYDNAKRIFAEIDFKEYDEIVFIAKSMGTGIACQLKEEFKIPASLVLFTPVEETLPYIHASNNILLVAAGDRDRYLDSDILQKICVRERIPYYIEPGVGHRMEVPGDLDRDLEIISNVLKRL